VKITIDVDPAALSSVSDKYLAGLWHVAQLNPAPIEDHYAADLAEKLAIEIVRRWLRATEPEMYHHQARHPYWHALSQIATYEKGEEDFYAGRWVPKGGATPAQPS